MYTLARVIAALLGTAALWLLYTTGARLFNRGVGLLAAAIEAVAFLPVFYAHLALNDAPTLAPVTLSLLGSAGVLRKGRRRDYLVAGVGLGLACASKYTAGIVLLPLLAAAATRYLSVPPGARAYLVGRRAMVGLLLAGAGALVAFLVANPYAVLDFKSFHAELVHQSTLSAEAQGKLGAPKEGGFLYYLWSLTWGLGWLPALAALGGAVAVWRREQRLGWLLVPRRCCTSRSWASRDATSAAGCCRSFRSSACLRRSSHCGWWGCPRSGRRRRSGRLAKRFKERRGGRGGQPLEVATGTADRVPRCSSWRCWHRASCTACTRAWCSRAPTRAT